MKKLLCACAVLVTVGAVVQAKPLSRILAESGLSSEDFDLMGQYAAGLYERGTPKAGSLVQWSNSETGAAGTVRLQETSGNCVLLRHEATAGGKDKPILIHTRRCKNADGIWVLQP